MAIAVSVHARERVQERIDPGLSDSEAETLLWEIVCGLAEETVCICALLCGVAALVIIRNGVVAMVELPGDLVPEQEAGLCVAAIVAA